MDVFIKERVKRRMLRDGSRIPPILPTHLPAFQPRNSPQLRAFPLDNLRKFIE